MSDKLLKVLDISSEEQQIQRLYELGYKDYFARRKCGDGITYECKTGSLRDLAFRLRDEVKYSKGKIRGLAALSISQRIVYDYVSNLPEKRPSLEWSIIHSLSFEDYKDYFSDTCKAIHWVIVALITMERYK